MPIKKRTKRTAGPKQPQYFKGLTIDDIYIDAVYLDEDVPKQTFTITKIG